MEDIKALEAQLAVLEEQKARAEKELATLKAKNCERLVALTESKPSKSRNFISAESARQTAEQTTAVKNHIAKFIQEEAKEGRTQLSYGIWGICDQQVKVITDELVSLGYKVDHDKDSNEMIIKW